MRNESPGRQHPHGAKRAVPHGHTTTLTHLDVDNTAPVRSVYSTTRFGKELSVVRAGVKGWKIAMSGGGTFPPELEGDFTHPKMAEYAINNYNPPKEE